MRMITRFVPALAIVALAAALAPPVKQVTVTFPKSTIVQGTTSAPNVTVRTANGGIVTGKKVTWSTSKPDIASIDSVTGLVTALAPGLATIGATVDHVLGQGSLTVVAQPPPPPPPPAPVASVAVSLGATSLAIGKTTSATALARDSSGDVLTNRVTIWASTAPLIASVTPFGIVSALTSGTALIQATVETKSASAPIVILAQIPLPDTTPPPLPSPGHPHEPAGFAKLSPNFSCDTVPLTTSGPSAPYELGWVQKYDNLIHIVKDSAASNVSKNVCEAIFPSGFIGGTSPGTDLWTYQYGVNPENWGAMTPPRTPKSLYMSFWYKVSPNFPANLVANKVIYPRVLYGLTPVITFFSGSADYPIGPNGYPIFAPNQATQYNAYLQPTIAFQEVEIDGNHFAGVVTQAWMTADSTKWHPIVRGQWHHWETLYTLEDQGKANGSAQLWLDGQLAISLVNRVRYIPLDQATQHVWHETIWGPVYGGGGSMPNDGVGGYHRMWGMYASGEAPSVVARNAAPSALRASARTLGRGALPDTRALDSVLRTRPKMPPWALHP